MSSCNTLIKCTSSRNLDCSIRIPCKSAFVSSSWRGGLHQGFVVPPHFGQGLTGREAHCAALRSLAWHELLGNSRVLLDEKELPLAGGQPQGVRLSIPPNRTGRL